MEPSPQSAEPGPETVEPGPEIVEPITEPVPGQLPKVAQTVGDPVGYVVLEHLVWKSGWASGF